MATIGVAGALVLLAGSVFYPYLPGGHDPLALPVSQVVQVVAAAALLLVPIGLLWLVLQWRGSDRRSVVALRRCGYSAAGVAVLGSLIAISVALGSSGAMLALLTAAFCAYGLASLLPHLTRLPAAPTARSDRTGWYLIGLPLCALALHVALFAIVTDASRNRAMGNAAVLIDALERHRAVHGAYPASLGAVSPDYKVGVVGIAQYHYTVHGRAYTLHFEQPLPVFSNLGTREFVAYHPSGDHLVLSHAAWHVTRAPAALAAGQGWYAVHETSRRGWKRFLFD